MNAGWSQPEHGSDILDIRKLQRAIVDGLEDVKAHDIVVFNTEALSPLFERVIIASGTSNRQTKALASSVRETVRKRGLPVLRTEGEENGEWIIVDCGAAVAHIMQPAIRDYYHLEEIWGAKPVKLKASASPRAGAGLPKAEADEGGAGQPEGGTRPPARKAAGSARKTARAPAGKTARAAQPGGASPRPARPAAKPAAKVAGRAAPKPKSRVTAAPAGRPGAGGKTGARTTAKAVAKPASRPARPAAKKPSSPAAGKRAAPARPKARTR